MKVMFLLSSDRYSGAENVVCQIASMFGNDDKVEMVYCSPDGEIRNSLEEKGIEFFPLTRMSVSEVRRAVKELKPDLVHAHDMRASFYAALTCGKTPLVSHIHNNAFDSRKISLKSIAYIFAALKASRIFWVSQSSFDGYAFHKLFKKKSSVLYNIIDVDALYEKMRCDTNEYDYDVAFVGRLTYPKNPQRLMNVFRMLKEKLPTVKIAVVGTGELEEETKALAKEYGISGNVDFLGFRSNPYKILHDSKVMIMTSRWEGVPMCALEAMALGVPIVSTPTDGLKELVVDEKNGYLCENNEQLADSACRIINDSFERKQLSEFACEHSRRLNQKEIYKKAIESAYSLK